MTAATLFPISVPEVFAARSISPVDNCSMLRSSTKILACVPLPPPGGPSRTIFIGELLHLFFHAVSHEAVISQASLHTDVPASVIELAELYPYQRTQ